MRHSRQEGGRCIGSFARLTSIKTNRLAGSKMMPGYVIWGSSSWFWAGLIACLLILNGPAAAQSQSGETAIEELRRLVEKQQQIIDAQQKRLEALERKIEERDKPAAVPTPIGYTTTNAGEPKTPVT